MQSVPQAALEEAKRKAAEDARRAAEALAKSQAETAEAYRQMEAQRQAYEKQIADMKASPRRVSVAGLAGVE